MIATKKRTEIDWPAFTAWSWLRYTLVFLNALAFAGATFAFFIGEDWAIYLLASVVNYGLAVSGFRSLPRVTIYTVVGTPDDFTDPDIKQKIHERMEALLREHKTQGEGESSEDAVRLGQDRRRVDGADGGMETPDGRVDSAGEAEGASPGIVDGREDESDDEDGASGEEPRGGDVA